MGLIIPGEDAELLILDKKEEETNGVSLDEFAQAISSPRPGRTSESYLNLLSDFSVVNESGEYESESKIKDAIKLSYRLYEMDGVVANTIDTYVDFSISDFQFHGVKNDNLKNLLEDFKRNVNKSNPLIERGVLALASYMSKQDYLAGNVFAEKKVAKRSKRINGRKRTYTTITSVHMYDPQKISIDEFNASAPILVQVNDNLGGVLDYIKRNGLTRTREDFRKGLMSRWPANVVKTALSLPSNIIKSVRKNSVGAYQVYLDDIFVMQRKKSPWASWGTPYVTRAFRSLAIKHKLQSLDLSTIDGLINLVTIFKVGDKDRPASSTRLQAFANLLQNAPRTNFLVWAHDVETESVGPKDKVLEMEKRYQQIDNQILEDLGLPQAFTRTNNSSQDPWVQIMRLMERITRHRRKISLFLEDCATFIAKENGFKEGTDYENITVNWKRNNLMNPAEIRGLVIQLYDRGLISKSSAIWQIDGSLEKELQDRIREKSEKHSVDGEQLSVDELIVPPALPFSKNERNEVEGDPSKEANRPKAEDVKEKKDTTVNLKDKA